MTVRSCLLSFAALIAPALAAAQQVVQVTELAPGTIQFQTPAGNVVAAVTSEGAFIVGPLSVASTPAIQAALATRTSSPVRYVIGAPYDGAEAAGDGGWAGQGALVVVHENLWNRFADSARLAAAGVARPQGAFSEVFKLLVGGHEMHAVHQRPGHSDADVLVHFETTAIVYLGESLAGDGYPLIDTAHGGTLEGLLQTIQPWAGSSRNRMVGARGGAMTGADVRAWRDMIVAVRDRIRALKQSGQIADQVVAARVTREHDGRYGSGRVTPEAFVRSVYQQVR